MPLVRVLSFHAGYSCRQSGVCCRAGWPIAVERDEIAAIREGVTCGRLSPRLAAEPVERATADRTAVLARPDGRCVFFDNGEQASCRVHAALGHEALPLACRQFPRVTILDPRGASVTLSHYCPTAAGMLDSETPVTIVDVAAGFRPDGEYVGLDARDGLPPLLCPDMAMDWHSWWALERASVEVLTRAQTPVEESLARLRAAVESIRTWRPGPERLIDRVRAAVADSTLSNVAPDSDHLTADLTEAIAPELTSLLPAPPRERVPPEPHVHRRFLAAHAYANWTAHLGLDLGAWLRSVETAHALLTAGYSVGEADLLLRHLADPHELARRWSQSATSRP